jgi:glucose-1-phosphate thymidylyltransferase
MRASDAGQQLSEQQQRAADAGLKGMIAAEGRPFLEYVIDALAEAGIRDVCLVIGPEHHAVRDHFALGTRAVRVSFAEQAQPRGTADAVLAGQAFTGDDVFLALNADNYYPVAAIHALVALGGAGLVGFEREALVAESNIPADRIRQFALIERDAEGVLTAIHEKPDEGTDARLGAQALVSMNLWSFTASIFEACRRVRPSVRGELELQDAVRIASAELGVRFRVIPHAGGVLDLSTRGDIPAVSAGLRQLRTRG